MKKIIFIVLVLAAILGVGLYFYTDGEILQGRFSTTSELSSKPESRAGEILKIESITKTKENTVTVVMGNITTKSMKRTFTAHSYLDGESYSVQRFPALPGLTGTEWILNTIPSGDHEFKVCLDEENVIEDGENCQSATLTGD